MNNAGLGEALTRGFLMYFLLPLWLAAGFADYLCHRWTRIETTSGWRESALHWAQLLEMAIPTLAALLFEINALVLLLMAVALLMHEATAWWDLNLATPRRAIHPGEQMVHSFLEMLPLLGLSAMVLLHWPQALTLIGSGTADFGLRWKQPPLPAWYQASLAAAVAALIVLPYADELRRCLRNRHRERTETADRWSNAGDTRSTWRDH